MEKLKVLTVVGTRPEIIRLSRIIPLLDQYCDHLLVHTGQNYDYDLNQVFFDDLGLQARLFSKYCISSTCVSQTIGNLIFAVDQVICETQPDASSW